MKKQFKPTKVFISKKGLKELRKLLIAAENMPMIATSSADALSGNDWASQAWDYFYLRCYKLALKNGLPNIKGYYGINIATGEFLKPI